MDNVYDKLMNCYQCVKSKIDFVPDVAIVLGSGLGDYGNEIRVEAELPYGEIEGFPVSTVPGHAGKFIFGYVGDVKVVCMQGRVHYYEGYPVSDMVLLCQSILKSSFQFCYLCDIIYLLALKGIFIRVTYYSLILG